MSSPSSSLRKIKRSPLPGQGSVPFRTPGLQHDYDPHDSPLLPSPASHSKIHSSHSDILEGIKHHSSTASPKHHTRSNKKNGSVPSDSQLLGSMAARLAQVEKELLAAKREIIERDNLIQQLQERVSVLDHQGSLGSGRSSQERELQMKCLALQKQIDEMEEFLNDYGMVWVGGSSQSAATDQSDSSVWLPGDSVTKGGNSVSVNFDLIIQNVKELNVLAGEGSAGVHSTPNGAQLKVVEPVPLTLYKNGIVMFGGPFRPFTDPSTHTLIQDLSEGYFPSELQSRYPEGVPLQLSDCRDVVYRSKEYKDVFPGSGQALGGAKGPSILLGERPVRRGAAEHKHKEVWELPGPKVSVDQFLSKLPHSVVRGGRVVDIRSGVSEALRGTQSHESHVTLVETPVLQEIKSRLDLSEDIRPPTPTHLTTLRIKSENGDQTYVLKMKYHNSIGDVRKHIDRLRPASSPQSYILKSSFPPRTFTDPSATLASCGLVPTGNLFMCQSK